MATTTKSGIGLSTVLVVVFFVLKVVGTIRWSWWWVFSPWLAEAGLLVFGLFILLVVMLADGGND